MGKTKESTTETLQPDKMGKPMTRETVKLISPRERSLPSHYPAKRRKGQGRGTGSTIISNGQIMDINSP